MSPDRKDFCWLDLPTADIARATAFDGCSAGHSSTAVRKFGAWARTNSLRFWKVHRRNLSRCARRA